MTEVRFVERHRATWEALEQLLRQPAADFAAIEQLNGLYRVVGGHLSYARTYYAGSSLCDYLGQLTAKAHAAVYASTERRRPKDFLTITLPRSVRRNGGFIGVAAAVFLLAGLFCYIVGLTRPDAAALFLPADYRGITAEDVRDRAQGGRDWSPATMSNTIMVNNIRVSILAFGLGLTLGTGTLYVLIFNGFLLGGLASIYALAGRSLLFWSLILPHGILELTAIFIAGGAGLRLGFSLLRPGPFRRRDALVQAARSVLPLLGAVVALLVVAAVIEGFFTPSAASPAAKLVFAALTGVLLLLAVWLMQRRSPAPTAADA